jgi:polysaccharide biosynthesis transport protein
MTEMSPHHSRRRAHSKGQFLGRFYRYRLLLLEKWWILLVGLAVGLIAGAGVWFFGPPSFSSEGRMAVPPQIKLSDTATAAAYSEDMGNFLGTQVELMRSRVNAERARARVLAQDSNVVPHQVLLKVTVLPKTSIFVLRATGEDPQYTRLFCQASMEEYQLSKSQMRDVPSGQTAVGLTTQLSQLEKQLRESQAEISAFASTNSVEVTQEQGNNSLANSLVTLRQELARYKSDYDLMQSLTLDQNLLRQQQGSDAPPSMADPDRGSSGNPNRSAVDSDYQKAKQELLILQAQRDEFGQVLKPKHPKMIAMSEEIARKQKFLEILQKQSKEQFEVQKTTLQHRISNLESNITAAETRLQDLNGRRQKYLELQSNLQRIQGLFNHLEMALKQIDIGKDIAGDPVTILEPAGTAAPDRSTLAKQLATGGLAGLALAIALLMVLERMDDRMTSFSELQELFDEEVLGQIPREKIDSHDKEPGLIEPEDERHAFVEAYRNLRSSLLYMSETGQRPKTLAVTSSVPNDGKSLTATNLAIIMANSGSRVLLVDADLRKGGLHHRLGLPPGPGLCEVLAEDIGWEQTVVSTRTPNLSLVPRGRTSQRSSELFISNKTEAFLKDAASKYDYVIVDTAPVMAADDVTSLAPHIDGVVFVIRAEHTSGRVARAALDLLYQRQANVLGVVFNAVHPKSSDYYYYYKYEDYYRAYPSGTAGGKKGHRHGGRDDHRSESESA